jgi:genome maintenance exonuclease 1
MQLKSQRFKHEIISVPELEQVNSSSGRYYVTPEGNHYPSVTTIIGSMSDKTWLKEWEERVGKREAQRISNQAGLRGTELHALCERYVLNKEINESALMPLEKMLYRQVKDALKDVDIIYGSELRLYSDRLKAAGSCDLFCRMNGKKTVLDFKTSKRPKEEKDILGYFLQTTMYALMIYELTGELFPKICVVITCDGDNKASVFEKNTNDYIQQVLKMCKDYHEAYSTTM